ncbi:hypothetical protein [Angustibacter sp. Root456]|uniref:hypothetical protein n=1 Tax=Angustibacter sp. Root456 TaxID=1736539 RepID=UPI000700C148|nr:hypothetical protein [Angustibacter sp. Root456]KQX66497.1 hypothetical protein ASD06_03700 [Angustibacter sp. Root456]
MSHVMERLPAPVWVVGAGLVYVFAPVIGVPLTVVGAVAAHRRGDRSLAMWLTVIAVVTLLMIASVLIPWSPQGWVSPEVTF